MSPEWHDLGTVFPTRASADERVSQRSTLAMSDHPANDVPTVDVEHDVEGRRRSVSVVPGPSGGTDRTAQGTLRQDRRRPVTEDGRPHVTALLGEVFPGDLGDLLEVVALYDVEEDDRRGVVALGVPGDGPRVCDALKLYGPQGGEHLGARGHPALLAGGRLDREKDEACRVVRVERIVGDGPVLRLVAGRELRGPGHSAHRGRGGEDENALALRRCPV